MIRKLLMIGAAAAIPLGAVSVDAVVGNVAGAVSSVTCSVSSTVTFAKPGITYTGTASKKTTSLTKTSNPVLGGAGCPAKSKGKGLKITSTNPSCATASPPVPGCSAKDPYYYGSAGLFASTGPSSLNGLTQLVQFGKVKVSLHVTSSSATGCAGGEAGFAISGTASGGGYSSFSETACLGTDTGTGTTGHFTADYGAIAGGGSGIIATAAIDPATSSLTVS